MEYQLFQAIVEVLAQEVKGSVFWASHQKYSDAAIVRVWFWAVIHDRPVCWAVQIAHWPIHLRAQLKLPSNATMSRRLRSDHVRQLLVRLEKRLITPTQRGWYWMIDGKPLPIGGCSKDRQAGYGRSAGGKAKGYKMHAIIDPHGGIAAWRLAPMNFDERTMAGRLLKGALDIAGYLVADSNYDSNKLHQLCERLGNLQLLTPRRYGPGKDIGHRSQSEGRLRSIGLLENPEATFGGALMQQRGDIERRFGNLTNWGGGLTHLPPWIRTWKRVHRWVQAKLMLTALKRRLSERT